MFTYTENDPPDMPSHRETDLAMIFSRLTLARAYLPKMDLADRLPAMKPHSPCRALSGISHFK